ncbi:hypothetical protein B9Z55_001296 [Caenorhabditis nigoni]|uniref:Uncharacterized protein n=1 Tax=Caenorhabditis nigoni TaxID=1611254 RepID=A0A2G5VF22_9PELO|nr:hypothetical protein B9Z55_001296 [Caenorhabditis nigoni]
MWSQRDALGQKSDLTVRLKTLEQKHKRLESSNGRKRSRENWLEKNTYKLQKLNEENAKSKKMMKEELRDVHGFGGVTGFSTLTNKKVKSGRVEEAIKSLQYISAHSRPRVSSCNRNESEKLEALDRNGKLIFDESKIWLCINGDKGGSHFKLCATIGNVEVSNSAYHIAPLGMFNDEENAENLACHLGNLITQLDNLTELESSIGGNKEKIPVVQFLGGDLKFE